MYSVVYPYSKCSSHELEWSIKSLKNVEHDKVYIIGDEPNCDVDATIIQPAVNKWSRLGAYNNVINKLLTITEHITGDFLFMNDDVFIMEEYDGTTYDRGELEDHIASRRLDSYARSLQNTLEWLADNGYTTKSYDAHTPVVFNSEKLKQLIQRILPTIEKGRSLQIRSLYGNVYGVESEYMPIDTKNPENYIGRTILSTNDITFRGKIGMYIRQELEKE